MTSLMLLLLQTQLVSVPSGYYTYPDLGKALTSAGVEVAVDNSLINRAAYVSMVGKPWNNLKKVLEAGLGISFVDRNGKLLMMPDLVEEEKQKKLLKGYVTRYEDHVKSVFSNGVARFEKIRSEREDGEKLELLAAITEANASPARLAEHLAVWMHYEEASPDVISMVAKNLDLQKNARQQMVYSSSLSNALLGGRFKYSPGLIESLEMALKTGGDPRKQREAFDKIFVFDRILFDPETGVLGYASDWHSTTQWMESTTRKNLSPQWAQPRIKLSELQSPEEAGLYAKRHDETREVGATLPPTPLNPTLTSMSHVAAKFSEKGKVDLVCEISAFGDKVASPRPNETFARYVARINEATLSVDDFAKVAWDIAPDINSALQGKEYALRTVLSPFKSWTLSYVEGVLVLKNELIFLDRFAQGPRFMSAKLESDLSNGSKPTFFELGEAANHVDWKSIHSPVIGHGLRRFPRPWKWAPFARLYAQDKAFRDIVDGIKVNEPNAIPFKQLPAGTRSLLIKFMRESAQGAIAHEVSPYTSPTFAALPAFEDELMKSGLEIGHIEIDGKCSYAFVLRSPPSRLLWVTQIDDLRPDR